METIPKYEKNAARDVITPIHEWGDKNTPSKYKPIVHTNHFTKIFERIFLKSGQGKLNKHVYIIAVKFPLKYYISRNKHKDTKDPRAF